MCIEKESKRVSIQVQVNNNNEEKHTYSQPNNTHDRENQKQYIAA